MVEQGIDSVHSERSVAKAFEARLPAARKELADALEDHAAAGGDPMRVVAAMEFLFLLRLGAEGGIPLKTSTIESLMP